MEAFKKLKYPAGLLHQLKRKAIGIMDRTTRGEERTKEYMAVPSSRKGEGLTKYLLAAGARVSQSSGRKIGDLVAQKSRTHDQNTMSVIYEIPCSRCESVYYGETSRGFEKRKNEHKNDVRLHRTSNSLVRHIDETNHLPNWDRSRILHTGLDKKTRRLTEAALITTNETTNHREGFYTLAKTTAKLLTLPNSNSRAADLTALAGSGHRPSRILIPHGD